MAAHYRPSLILPEFGLILSWDHIVSMWLSAEELKHIYAMRGAGQRTAERYFGLRGILETLTGAVEIRSSTLGLIGPDPIMAGVALQRCAELGIRSVTIFRNKTYQGEPLSILRDPKYREKAKIMMDPNHPQRWFDAISMLCLEVGLNITIIDRPIAITRIDDRFIAVIDEKRKSRKLFPERWKFGLAFDKALDGSSRAEFFSDSEVIHSKFTQCFDNSFVQARIFPTSRRKWANVVRLENVSVFTQSKDHARFFGHVGYEGMLTGRFSVSGSDTISEGIGSWLSDLLSVREGLFKRK